MGLSERSARLSGRAKALGNETQGLTICFFLLKRGIRKEEWDSIRTIIFELDELHKPMKIEPWIAVRSETHHFIFVGCWLEAQVEGENTIQNTQRVKRGDLLNDLDTTRFSQGNGHTMDLAHCICDKK